MITNYLMGSGILYNKNKTEPKNTSIMAHDSEQIDELRTLIEEELKDCSGHLWPKVCEMRSTEKGKFKLENMIIRMIADEGMGIGSAIAHIEQELAHMI
ncbi:MAG: hypothetical protein JST26_05670 [Bacteroidetes bacterium]|nr:hypothetical protein [Bacteroidota bacterium]